MDVLSGLNKVQGVIEYVRAVHAFTRKAKEYLHEDEQLLAAEPTLFHEDIRAAGRRILWCAGIGMALPSVIIDPSC